MLSLSALILGTVDGSMSGGTFFSAPSTTPYLVLIPRAVDPFCTAFRAYSICESFPLGLNTVSE